MSKAYGITEASAKRVSRLIRKAQNPDTEMLGRDLLYARNTQKLGFWGKIVTGGPNGEGDETDNRYWVKRVYLDVGQDGTPPGTFKELTKPDPNANPPVVGNPHYLHVSARNICEELAKTHTLALNTICWVQWEYDSKGNTTYFIELPAQPGLGQYQHMLYQNVTDNQVGWDWLRAHALL